MTATALNAPAEVAGLPADLLDALREGRLLPYLGPGMLALCEAHDVPADPLALVGRLTAKATVPGKIRHRLTQAAQFIENFKHRRTLVAAMQAAFGQPTRAARPSALHRLLAQLAPPLVVDLWYDDTMRQALADAWGERADAPWGEVQGLSQSEHFGTWCGWYGADGTARIEAAPGWDTVLYRPWGGHRPAANYLVSDSDFVEVLTEIDIQTPIPPAVQRLRTDRGFLFLGCRFDDQLARSFARQILKRSGGPHYAVLPGEPTRMEARFLAEAGITRIALPLDVLAAALATADAPTHLPA